MTTIQNTNGDFPLHIDAAIFTGLTQPLADFGVIRARGADAAQFLHGQLSQDFALLGPLQCARLAAYCSPKGRVLASFIGIKLAADDIVLLVATDLLEATLKRLRMFVLRARCELSDASAAFTVRGAAGSATLAALGAGHLNEAWALHGDARTLTIALPSVPGVPRALVVSANDRPDALQAHQHEAIARLELPTWQWLDTASGCHQVRAGTTDAFVPQMLNYESLGGVHFKKGCYPGQEVVARSQFRGAIKRRTFVAKIVEQQSPISDLPPGSEVFTSAALADAEPQPTGLVLQTAPTIAQLPAIAQISMASADAHTTLIARNAAAETVTLFTLGLPYALLNDI